MFDLWKDLFKRMGLQRKRKKKTFELDAAMELKLEELAEKHRKPASEIRLELLEEGLAHHQRMDMWIRKWDRLSPREQQVTAFTCLGFTNRQIGARLHISEETVKTHVANTLVKFGLHSKSSLQQVLSEWDFSEWDR